MGYQRTSAYWILNRDRGNIQKRILQKKSEITKKCASEKHVNLEHFYEYVLDFFT